MFGIGIAASIFLCLLVALALYLCKKRGRARKEKRAALFKDSRVTKLPAKREGGSIIRNPLGVKRRPDPPPGIPPKHAFSSFKDSLK